MVGAVLPDDVETTFPVTAVAVTAGELRLGAERGAAAGHEAGSLARPALPRFLREGRRRASMAGVR